MISRIPTIIKPVAGPLTKLGSAVTGGGVTTKVGGALAAAALNSGNSDNDFHSVVPSGRILVWALARPSAIHCRNCSAEIGPYSRPSAPIILYIVIPSRPLLNGGSNPISQGLPPNYPRSGGVSPACCCLWTSPARRRRSQGSVGCQAVLAIV